MWYPMRRSCTKINYRERNGKRKIQNIQCLMKLKKMKFQRNHKNKMINKNNSKKYLKLLQVTIRRSTKLSRSPKRYSPSLYYALLTDFGEPEGYEEVVHVETRKKWEQSI